MWSKWESLLCPAGWWLQIYYVCWLPDLFVYRSEYPHMGCVWLVRDLSHLLKLNNIWQKEVKQGSNEWKDRYSMNCSLPPPPQKKPNTSSERASGTDCWDDSSHQDNLGSCTEEKWRTSPLLGAIKDSVTIGWRRDYLWPCCKVEVSPLNQMNATHFS